MNFAKCALGNLIGICTSEYRYSINDIVETNSGKLKILEHIKIKHGNRDLCDKGYKYKCLICGYEGQCLESGLTRKQGCPVCCTSPQKLVIGINDMWTTNPELAKLLANPEDGYKYMQNSNKKTDWKCPDCGEIIKNKMISTINNHRLICPRCSDGVSYPNKFMFNVLQQLNIDFINEYSPDWIKPKKYDFYFEINNNKYIVEMDGQFHIQDNSMNGQTKEESKAIDDYKDKLARENNVTVIRIDSLESNLEYLKNNILHSELNNIFDFSNIDWIKCHQFACNSRVKEASELWNSGVQNAFQISQTMKVARGTIIKYLKKATECGWCEYNAKEEERKSWFKNKIIEVN